MMFFILIWSVCALGFFALAGSMEKHQKQIYGHVLNAAKTKLSRVIGWLLLILGLIICMVEAQLSNMISYWVGVLTFAALFIGVCISYCPQHLKKISVILIFCTLGSLVMQMT